MPRDFHNYHTSTGSYWLPYASPDHIIQTIIQNGIFDQPLIEAMKALVSPGDVYLDVGSNFGQSTVLMSYAVGPTGKVIAFEADPWIGSALKENIKQNKCTNTEVIIAAVWDESNLSLIYSSDDLVTFGSYGSYGIDPNATEGQQVKSITIDSLNLDRVNLIKIDAQGSDLNVLKGARDTIRRLKPNIIFEYEQLFNNRFNTSWNDYLQFISDIDYRITQTISYDNHLIQPK